MKTERELALERIVVLLEEQVKLQNELIEALKEANADLTASLEKFTFKDYVPFAKQTVLL